MNVRILRISKNELVDAKILNAKSTKLNLPSISDGWRFNFKKQAKEYNHEAYILVSDETPDIIEGCLIFEMKGKVEPYMAFIEVAPHNKDSIKRYERIAGCLIAFACRLSFIKANEPYKGYLVFDVLEENKEDEVKLMALYSIKYNALRYRETTMIIVPEGGEKLITEFLN